MANIFKSKVEPVVGSVPVSAYITPLSSTSFIVGATFANLTGSNISVTVTLYKSSSNEEGTIIKDAPVPPGSAIQVLNGEKIVMEPEDEIRVVSNTPNSMSSVLSIMEIR